MFNKIAINFQYYSKAKDLVTVITILTKINMIKFHLELSEILTVISIESIRKEAKQV
jgi:hypothetical protein